MVKARYFNNFFSVYCYEFFRNNDINPFFHEHLPVFKNRFLKDVFFIVNKHKTNNFSLKKYIIDILGKLACQR